MRKAVEEQKQILTFGKKYYYHFTEKDDKIDQRYYIFEKNGTGIYRTYWIETQYSIKNNYTVNFKYTIIEETVVCFYDSVTYEENNEVTIDSNWNRVLGFSENVLVATNGGVYVCETYLPEIPHYFE